MNTIKSEFFKLNLQDVSKALVVAVLVAVLQAVLVVLQGKGLAFSSADLLAIGSIAVKSGAAYLLKNFFSDQNGLVLGRIG